MDPVISEWLNLVIRWIHVITGIAWIGASFYFNWLLIRLRDPESDHPRVLGELWAIHAGGFFRVQKRRIEPGQLPAPLHWFKWEAYWTWISGFLLLVLVYYVGAELYLVDPEVADIGPGFAVALGIGTLVLGWLVYDLLWRSRLARHAVVASSVSFLLLAALSYGLDQIFSARGAYIHVGAVLGTLMVGNVFFVIMPAQRELVAATNEGRAQDPALTERAELRSLHNNYLTLPVLFVMISNHYPSTYGHEQGWLVLLGLFLVGAGVRHYFNVRERRGNWGAAGWLAASAAGVIAIAYVTVAPAPPRDGVDEQVAFVEVREVISRHCVSCHSARPTSELFKEAPKGVAFDTADQIRRHAAQIHAQTVATRVMPLGNLTRMTSEERALIGNWIAQGAQTP